MVYTSSYQSKSHGMELDYNKIHFHLENTHRAKIYKDFMNRYATGVMYILVEILEVIDNIVPRELSYVEKVPPMLVQLGLKVTNSIWTQRVLIDDVSKYYIRDKI